LEGYSPPATPEAVTPSKWHWPVSQGGTAALMTRNYLEKLQGNRGDKGD